MHVTSFRELRLSDPTRVTEYAEDLLNAYHVI